MIEEAFIQVYTKFKLHFYKSLFEKIQQRETSLTTVETYCIEIIHAMGNPTIGEFASFIQISSPNAAYKVNSLIKKGYVRKVQSEDDKREYHLEVTDKYFDYYNYKGYIRKSLHRFKFGRARHYAAGYGRLLAMRLLTEYPEGFDVLTWVPISKVRKFTRGYDQVELLAKAVGAELGMQPVATLKKLRNNRPQSSISGQAQRRANVLGVYRAIDPEVIRGKRILLLDDIITTGATAGECARVLLTAGAKEVHCGCVAAAHRK